MYSYFCFLIILNINKAMESFIKRGDDIFAKGSVIAILGNLTGSLLCLDISAKKIEHWPFSLLIFYHQMIENHSQYSIRGNSRCLNTISIKIFQYLFVRAEESTCPCIMLPSQGWPSLHVVKLLIVKMSTVEQGHEW